MTEKEFRKYAKRATVAETEPPLPAELPRDCVVIPACDERVTLPAALDSLRQCDGGASPLILVVLNHPADAAPAVREATFQTAEMLKKRRDPNLHWIVAPDLTGGVGAARKLGMDTLLMHLAPVQTDSALFYSFDADTLAERDYFSRIRARFEAEPEVAALTVGFSHQPGGTPELETAIRRYEAYLHRYVEKLAGAGSPYAFHTVGSAFAVRASAYLRAGGMRVKTCGEDFYFLQAAAKTGIVKEERAVLVHPSARASTRVPFGTGPAVRKLMEGGALTEVSDEAFQTLKELLRRAGSLGATPDEAWFSTLPLFAQHFLRAEKFPEAWRKIVANTPEKARIQAFHTWFDGLKTLRFLHFADASKRLREEKGNSCISNDQVLY